MISCSPSENTKTSTSSFLRCQAAQFTDENKCNDSLSDENVSDLNKTTAF